MIKVEGKNGISATILADSISEAGIRITSYEVTYPRIVLAENNTHAMLAKNSASSRAIPFAKMAEQLTGRPVRFGQANKGMQDKGEDFDALVSGKPYYVTLSDGSEHAHTPKYTPEQAWDMAREDALFWSKAFYEAGYHKQVYNRLTESFQMMKTVITATEIANYFWLRDHGAADPTIHELAKVMREARAQSTPVLLKAGEWHLPYVDFTQEVIGYDDDDNEILGPQHFYIWPDDAVINEKAATTEDFIGMGDMVMLSLDEAIKVSAARSAAVSFRNVDYGLEKSEEVHDRLVGEDRIHGSAMEHQATPIAPRVHDFERGRFLNNPADPDTWEKGISHADRDRNLWSGKFKGWIQYRKLIPNENYTEEV